jgi:uncharacterized iron-regulated membrane protein
MQSDLYRAFWRWHFYAGLIALPFLVWLAITGGLYLFKPEVERLVYGNWITLSAPREPEAISSMIARVQQQTGGAVTQIERPASASESWRLNYKIGGQARTAFVDPSDGRVLGTTSKGGVMETVKSLHSLAITGKFGNTLVEIAAGWAIILIVTGAVLWWPRPGQLALALRPPAGSRRFWRDLHASTGAVAGLIVFFLATTGMPWSIFWGASLQKVIAAENLGRPAAPSGMQHHGGEQQLGAGHERHGALPTGERKQALPWAMQATAMPMSHGTGDIGVDRVAAVAAARGLIAPYVLNLPTSDGKPYQVSRGVGRVEDTHVLYIEASSGRVLQNAAYRDFGTGAKLIEWGVQTHQGLEYPPVNRWVMLVGCIGILLLASSAPVLWWKRRDAGRLVRPPRPRDDKRLKMGTAVAVVLGIIYPLTGVTVLTVLLFDVALHRRKPTPARA